MTTALPDEAAEMVRRLREWAHVDVVEIKGSVLAEAASLIERLAPRWTKAPDD